MKKSTNKIIDEVSENVVDYIAMHGHCGGVIDAKEVDGVLTMTVEIDINGQYSINEPVPVINSKGDVIS